MFLAVSAFSCRNYVVAITSRQESAMSDRARVVSVRLSEAEYQRYSSIAADKQLSLSTYLRERLDPQDSVSDQLEALRRAIEDAAGRRSVDRNAPTPPTTNDQAALLELLLLLRQFAGPQKMDVAQKELKRRGIEPWR
jgi:hypothetical protein